MASPTFLDALRKGVYLENAYVPRIKKAGVLKALRLGKKKSCAGL
jgi:hypothetical protein